MRPTLRNLAAALMAATVPLAALTAAPEGVPASGVLAFDVLRGGKDIGDMTLRFTRSGDRLTVRQTTDVHVRLPLIGVSAYAYTQDSTETWQGGRLTSLASTTDDNGTPRKAATGPTPLIPASLWNAGILTAKQVLNTEDGSVMPITVTAAGTERVATGGGTVTATHYVIGGGLARDLWFDADHRLVHVRFTADDGSTIDYALR